LPAECVAWLSNADYTSPETLANAVEAHREVYGFQRVDSCSSLGSLDSSPGLDRSVRPVRISQPQSYSATTPREYAVENGAHGASSGEKPARSRLGKFRLFSCAFALPCTQGE